MRLNRLLIIVAAAIAILAVAAVAIVLISARTPMARRAVADAIAQSVGLPATIDSMRIGLWRGPALEIEGLRIAQPAGFGPEPLLAVGRIRAEAPWKSLFGSRNLESLAVSDPTAHLVVAASGDANWSPLFERPAVPAGAESAPRWSVGKVDLERGAIAYEDRTVRSQWRLTAITLAATDVAPGAPFPAELRGGGVFGTHTIHYALGGQARLDLGTGSYEATALEFTGWAGGDPLPLAGVELAGTLKRAAYEMAADMATFEGGTFELAAVPGQFSGKLDLAGDELGGDIQLETGVFEPRRPAVAFGFPLPATSDPAAYGAMQVSLQMRMQNGDLHLDPVSGRLDDTSFDGRIVPVRRLIRANLDRIDLNRYLPAGSPQATRSKRPTLEAEVAELARLDIDVEIRIAEARIGRAKVRDAVIRVERTGESR